METAAPRRSLDIFNTTSSGDSDSQTIGACPENADAKVQLAPDTRSLSLVGWPSTTNTTTTAAAAAAATATTTTPPTSSPPLDRTITRPSQPRPLCLLLPPPSPSLPPPSRPSTRLPPLCVPLSPNSEFGANRGLPRPTSAPPITAHCSIATRSPRRSPKARQYYQRRPRQRTPVYRAAYYPTCVRSRVALRRLVGH